MAQDTGLLPTWYETGTLFPDLCFGLARSRPLPQSGESISKETCVSLKQQLRIYKQRFFQRRSTHGTEHRKTCSIFHDWETEYKPY